VSEKVFFLKFGALFTRKKIINKKIQEIIRSLAALY
jgi:hypothetical protein